MEWLSHGQNIRSIKGQGKYQNWLVGRIHKRKIKEGLADWLILERLQGADLLGWVLEEVPSLSSRIEDRVAEGTERLWGPELSLPLRGWLEDLFRVLHSIPSKASPGQQDGGRTS